MQANELAVLKAQLRLAMRQVTQREEVLRRAADQMARQPRTIAEVEALQKKLGEAMEDLRARRAEIQKKGETRSSDDKKGKPAAKRRRRRKKGEFR
jgi:hypothetical protein